MSNIMSLKTIMNKPSRNGFDLSSKRNFTAKTGELLPVWLQEVIPGDKFTIDLKAITRTMPVNTAAFARIREYYDFYFVPYHLLWNRANEVLSQMDYNQQHSIGFGEIPTPFSGELPYVTASQIGEYIRTLKKQTTGIETNYFGYDRATLTCKLLEYLQYGNFDTYLKDDNSGLKYNPELNVMSLLAYQKIYSDYYRFQQWEKPNPSTFNVDYLSGSTSMNLPLDVDPDQPFYQNYNMFDLRYCNWPKDLYHGLLPNAQYGDTAVVPLDTGSLSVSYPQTSGNPGPGGNYTQYTGALSLGVQGNYVTGGGQYFLNGDDTGSLKVFVVNPNSINLGSAIEPATLSVGGGLSILALRQYEFLQKWKEIANAGDQDYKAITKRIWNVDVATGLSDKCQYLGGIASSLDINEVVNTNITGDNAAQIAGKGFGQSNGKITYSNDGDGQYGVIMCIYHCMPLVDYTVDYVAPMHTRINAEDFANPVFDRVGMQSVSSLPILQTSVTSPEDLTPPQIGYAPRYIDYKTAIDLSFGGFKRGQLQSWVVSYGYDDVSKAVGSSKDDNMLPEEKTDSELTYPFFKINPNMLDPIFSKNVDSTIESDQFLCSSFFDVKAVRNLDVDGLPY